MAPRTFGPPSPPGDGLRRIQSADGTLRFTLQRRSGGVFVERVQVVNGGSQVRHAAVFGTAQGFERYCGVDLLRFEHPLVFQRLLREFHELAGAA